MKTTLKDFGINFKNVPLLCDNESAVKLTNNPVQHQRTNILMFVIISLEIINKNKLNILDFSNMS
jgi:hypothetical protein